MWDWIKKEIIFYDTNIFYIFKFCIISKNIFIDLRKIRLNVIKS